MEHEAEVERKGKLKGRRESKQEAIRVVLVARGLSVSDEVLARIVGCEDMEMLDEWLVWAARVGDAEDIFG